MSDYNRKEARTAFSQPGIRYSQAESLIKSLMQDDKFRDLSLVERKRVTERILAEIKANVSRSSRCEYTGRCDLQYLRRFETESEYRDYLLLNAMRGSHKGFPSKHCNKNMLLFVRVENN